MPLFLAKTEKSLLCFGVPRFIHRLRLQQFDFPRHLPDLLAVVSFSVAGSL